MFFKKKRSPDHWTTSGQQLEKTGNQALGGVRWSRFQMIVFSADQSFSGKIWTADFGGAICKKLEEERSDHRWKAGD